MYNIRTITKNERLYFNFYELPMPDDESLKYTRHSEGLSWHDHLMKEWKSSEKEIVICQGYEAEVIGLVCASINFRKDKEKPYSRLFHEFFDKGVACDFLKKRIEIVKPDENSATRFEPFAILKTKSETQDEMFDELYEIFHSWPDTVSKIEKAKQKFTISRNKNE